MTPDRRTTRRRHLEKRLIVAATLVALLVLATGCGGSGDRSAQIASDIQAEQCARTDYQLINRLDHSKTTIYDCTMADNPLDANGVQTFGSKHICVTESDGIASDVTATAKLLFANALSGGKPTCAS